LRAALKAKVQILMLHENDPKCGGCEFATFFSTTPKDLIVDGLYKALAVSLFPKPFLKASLALAALELGAKEKGSLVAMFSRRIRGRVPDDARRAAVAPEEHDSWLRERLNLLRRRSSSTSEDSTISEISSPDPVTFTHRYSITSRARSMETDQDTEPDNPHGLQAHNMSGSGVLNNEVLAMLHAAQEAEAERRAEADAASSSAPSSERQPALVRRQNTAQLMREQMDLLMRVDEFPDAPETPVESDEEDGVQRISRASTVGQVISTGSFELGETSALSVAASDRIDQMMQEAEAEAKRLKAEAEKVRRDAERDVEEFKREAMREAERIIGDAHRDRDIALAEVAATAGLARRSHQELVRQQSGCRELPTSEARRSQCSWTEREEALAMSSEGGSCSDLRQLRVAAPLASAPEHAVAEVAVAGRWPRLGGLRITLPRRNFLDRTVAGSSSTETSARAQTASSASCSV
jgi:hypothetical protein